MNAILVHSQILKDRETIVDLLIKKSIDQPDRDVYSFLDEQNQIKSTLTYLVLAQRARGIAAVLQNAHAAGERAILLYPPGLDFISAFFGCLSARVIAVPSYPPDPARFEQTLPRLLAVIADAQAQFVLTTSAVLRFIQSLPIKAPALSALHWIATDALEAGIENSYSEQLLKPDDLAYLQYTSGSTRMPRGVRITHGCLVQNAAQIDQKFSLSSEDIAIIWLPIQHNMGLIGGVLQPFFSNVRNLMMSPQAFLQQPLRWLDAISRYGGTVSGGPNFAYDLCLQRIQPADCDGLNLKQWQLAFNGAEPVRPETIERFSRVFGAFGFRREAFYPSYGLAEATLMVTGGLRGMGPVTITLDKKSLEHHQVRELAPTSQNAATLVSCGTRMSDQDLRVINPETRLPAAPDEIGELWLAGPSVADGYWNHPDETQETFQGFLAGTHENPFLRTGDLGFMRNGECFITGRIKDLIIIRGRNHYPQDIEKTIETSHAALLPNGGAAFSVEMENEEKLVIVQEVIPEKAPDLERVAQAVRQKVSEMHELQAQVIVLVEPNTILRTVSGKIQHQATRKQFLEGSLKALYTSKIEQLAEAGSAPMRTENLLHSALVALGPEKGLSLLESFLTGKVSELLKISGVKLDPTLPLSTNGLDSITSVELSREVELALGFSYPMDRIFQGVTIRGMALEILDQLGKTSQPAGPTQAEVVEAQPEVDYPLSHGQRALWFVQKLDPQSVAHNIVYGAYIHAAVDPALIKKAMLGVVSRHTILRTTFIEVDGLPRQVVHAHGDLDFQSSDASTWTSDALDRRMTEEVFHVFDLKKGPLFRVTLLKLGPEKSLIILALHHIITDLWSMAILLHEFGKFLEAEKNGTVPDLKDVTAQFTDQVSWEESMLAGPQGETDWLYWKERLAGELPGLNLPTDRPKPSVQTARGAAYTIQAGRELTLALKNLSKTCDANLFSTLLAAFYTLLYRYTGQTDLIIGTPKANRSRRNAGMMGYFINPVVLRAALQEDTSFQTLLNQVYRNVLADFQHDTFPFPLLVKKLQPGRDLSTSPIFQIFYSWQKTTHLMDNRAMTAFALGQENIRFDLGGLPIEAMPLKDRVTPTDLALLVAESEDDLGLTIEYNTDLFDPESIAQFMAHYLVILNSISIDWDQKVSLIPILSPGERDELLAGWQEPLTLSQDYPARLLHQWVELAAEKYPDRPAVSMNGEVLTYSELIRRSQQLAGCLRLAGVEPGVVIGVSFEREPALVVSLLGIWMAGGAFLPIDPEFPEERRDFMLADSQARIVLTQGRLSHLFEKKAVRTICLDSEWAEIERDGTRFRLTQQPFDTAGLDHLAYVMFTSGSTGKPKAVMVSHRAIAHHCTHIRDFYGLRPEDHVLQFASLNFDAALEQIFTTLISGAQLILRDQELWVPAQFSKKIADLNLTVINVPPAYWQQWLQAETYAADPTPIPQLRLVIVGGDILLPEVLKLWAQIGLKNARLINAYGPTEATITAAAFEVPKDAFKKLWRVPIGKPLCGRKAYILDRCFQPVPVGVPGELMIGGTCLAMGYLNRPELSSDRFIRNPFTASPQQIYRTGDLARYLKDGNIEFLGRADRQIKVRGIRMEPGEIETALLKYPAVLEAVVLLHDAGAGAELTVCLVVQAGQRIDLFKLRDFISRQLPAYMVPANYLVCDRLPLTAGGKIDREALAKAARLQMNGSEYTAPRNPLEEDLADMWARLLNKERIGVYDDFFALGGHSLLATQLISRVQEKYFVDLALRRLFQTPTVAGLASAITQAIAQAANEDQIDEILGEIEKL